jgi:Protein of unknown function (DUF3179)
MEDTLTGEYHMHRLTSVVFCWVLTGLAVCGSAAEPSRIVVKARAFKDLTSPDCVRAKEESTLPQDDIILGVVRGDEQCAYPLRVMGEHRIINDSLGGPFVITWDEDSASARAFVPVVDGRRLHFEFHGWDRGVMILRDKESGSLWSHLTGMSSEGALKGTTLEPIAVFASRWQSWKTMYPESWVLGFDYANLYERKFELANTRMGTEAESSLGPVDDRLDRDTRVVGMRLGRTSVAVRVNARHSPASSLEIAGNRVIYVRDQVGTSVAVVSEIDGKPLTLEIVDSRDAGGAFTKFAIRDRESGSTFDITGRGTSGPLKGKQLRVLPSVETKWFAWAAFHPETSLVDAK